MNLIREPFADLNQFLGLDPNPNRRWSRLFDAHRARSSERSPAADITETDKEYLIRAEMPGVNREDLNVSVESGVITIRGERRPETEKEGEKRHRIELRHGSFDRKFALPANARSDIRAECRDGVLSLYIPKLTSVKSKTAQIKVD